MGKLLKYYLYRTKYYFSKVKTSHDKYLIEVFAYDCGKIPHKLTGQYKSKHGGY